MSYVLPGAYSPVGKRVIAVYFSICSCCLVFKMGICTVTPIMAIKALLVRDAKLFNHV